MGTEWIYRETYVSSSDSECAVDACANYVYEWTAVSMHYIDRNGVVIVRWVLFSIDVRRVRIYCIDVYRFVFRLW